MSVTKNIDVSETKQGLQHLRDAWRSLTKARKEQTRLLNAFYWAIKKPERLLESGFPVRAFAAEAGNGAQHPPPDDAGTRGIREAAEILEQFMTGKKNVRHLRGEVWQACGERVREIIFGL